MVKKKLTICV